MLSDHPLAQRYAVTLNWVVDVGRARTRNGWVQRVDVASARVLPWGDRALLLGADGRLRVWDGRLHDLGGVPALLDATPFAALVDDAAREDRLYFSDGAALRYVRGAGGAYALHTPTNTVLSASGEPYALTAPALLVAWRGRLWGGGGGNRLWHSQLEEPHAQDPLWTLEFQTPRADQVRALLPMGERLMVGCARSLWAVSGYSHYDWTVTQVVDGRGPVGRGAMATDGERLFYLAAGGLYELGRAQAWSDPDLSETFRALDPAGSIALAPDGRHLWVAVHGRLLVLDTLSGGWSEHAAAPAGVLALDDALVWYGSGGLWSEGQRADADLYADGHVRAVAATLEGWDTLPNPTGRAVLERVRLALLAPHGGTAHLRAVIDGRDGPAADFDLTPRGGLPAPTLAVWDGVLRSQATRPVVRELPVGRAGHAFRLAATFSAPAELQALTLTYRPRRA